MCLLIAVGNLPSVRAQTDIAALISAVNKSSNQEH